MNFCKKSLILLFFSSISGLSVANNHFYVNGAVSDDFSKVSRNNPSITYNDNQITDNYPLKTATVNRASLGLGAGYEWGGRETVPSVGFGLGVYSNPNPYRYSGQVAEAAVGDPGFLLYDYKFYMRTTRLMAELQLTWSFKSFLVFVNGGVGPSWNSTNGYKETPVNSDTYVTLPAFKSATTRNFAYQAGLGIGYAFNFDSKSQESHERLTLGYRYTNVGTNTLGTRGSAYPYKLSLGQLTSNNIYLTFTHLF